MKKKIFGFVVGGGVLLVLIVLGVVFLMPHKEVEIQDITSFQYFYFPGTGKDDRTSYGIQCEEKCVATIMLPGDADEDSMILEVSDDKMKELEDILKKYHVGRWNGFVKTNKLSKSGKSFSVSVSMDNGESIAAYGYMKWPRNFKKVSNALDSFFKSL